MSTLPYFYPKTSSHYSYVNMIWPFESIYSKRGIYILITTSVVCAIGRSVNPLQNRETQHVNIVLQYMYQFFEQQNMKACLNWMASLQDLSHSQLIFPSKTWFLKFYLNFLNGKNHLEIKISHIVNWNLAK
jgi:hypothetical protein